MNLIVKLNTETSMEAIVQAVREACDGSMKRIIGITDEEMVSQEFV